MHGEPGSLSSPEVITYQVNSSIYHMRPDMAADRFGNVHVAWTGPGGVINYMKRDTDGVWGSVEPTTSGIAGYDNWAAVAVDYLGAVHIAFHIAYSTYMPGYVNNRSGSWQGSAIAGYRSGNNVGCAVDPDGNAYVDWWTGSGGDRRIRVALIDRGSNVVEVDAINDNMPYVGSWCTIAGQTDPCYDEIVSVLATWRDYPYPPAPWYGRIQTDY